MRSTTRLALLVLALTGCMGVETATPQIGDAVDRLPPGRHEVMTRMPSGEVIRYTLYVPATTTAAAPPLVVAAHFGGQVFPWLGGAYADLLVVPALSELGAVIVAPDARSTGGWSAADEQGTMWLAREVARVYSTDPRKAIMTGYSAGGGQTWLVANANQDFFTAVVPMSARPRPNPEPWRIPVNVIHSTADELTEYSTVEAFVQAQAAAGAPMRLQQVAGISHYQTAAFVPALREAAAWLREAWR